MTALLAACFFVSGAAGLAYEVLWSRHLALLFGANAEAVGLVLAVFMSGLGLGSRAFGALADRSRSPLRLYAALEAGIGLFALATGPLLAAVS
ncbi:MAG: spermine synthase, partial [Thermoanaerobaculia bacterium]